MTEDRPAEQNRPDGTPRRALSAANPILRPLVSRTRDLIAGPVQLSEQRLLQRADQSDDRVAGRIDDLHEQLADSIDDVRAAAHEQRLLYTSIRTLLEEQAEQIAALRAEVAVLRGSATASEPSR